LSGDIDDDDLSLKNKSMSPKKKSFKNLYKTTVDIDNYSDKQKNMQ
jgi:hypothetical protein